MPVSSETYERVALEDPEGQWELVCGQLRRKPGMTMEHNQDIYRLERELILQLPPGFQTRQTARVLLASGQYLIPDLIVIPVGLVGIRRGQPTRLETYDEPLPLVVEAWSRSTGDYDVETKFAGYRERGDLEIWRIHPYEHTLTAWRRQPDGEYTETVYRSGEVRPAALPGVVIRLAELFA